MAGQVVEGGAALDLGDDRDVARPRRAPRRCRRAETTNEAATRSTPISRPKARSARSLSVTTGRPSAGPGEGGPLVVGEHAPLHDHCAHPLGDPPGHPHFDEPVGEEHPVALAPGRQRRGAARRPGAAPPSPSPSSKVIRAPVGSSTQPPGKVPTRMRGPWMSCSTATARPCSAAAAGAPTAAIGRGSRGVPWEKLSRATSMPAATRRPIISREATAGPRVAMILVLRGTVRPRYRHGDGPGRAAARRPAPGRPSPARRRRAT